MTGLARPRVVLLANRDDPSIRELLGDTGAPCLAAVGEAPRLLPWVEIVALDEGARHRIRETNRQRVSTFHDPDIAVLDM